MQLDLTAAHARHPALPRSAPDTLQGINLRLRAGEAVAVIGPSGAGKTSLLQVLGCALPLSQGQLLLDGQDPWRLRSGPLQRLRGQLFIGPQTPPLPPRQRVVTAVLAARLPQWSLLRSLGSLLRPRLADAQAVHDALAPLGLADKLWERVDRLSGGERQRVGLARALVGQARLWLVDEPLSALDPQRAQAALALLVREAAQRQATLVASLHHVDLALQAFPRIVGLGAGRVVFDLPTAAVTPALLAQLYGGQAPEASTSNHTLAEPPDADPPRPRPVSMTCR